MASSRLTLISDIEKIGRRYIGMYRCECGTEKRIDVHKVHEKRTLSCGCLAREALRQRQTKHGRYYEPEYRVWSNMLKRCNDARFAKWYGNVMVHSEWVDSYDAFLRDVGRKPAPSATLDRINPKGDYVPSNVRWTTRAVQSRNTKNHSTNKTGIRGVSWSRAKNKWRAAIYVDNAQKHLGYFEDIKDAAEARRKAEEKFWQTEALK